MLPTEGHSSAAYVTVQMHDGQVKIVEKCAPDDVVSLNGIANCPFGLHMGF